MKPEEQSRFASYQRNMRENPTTAEAAMQRALDKLEIKYTFQKGFLRDKTFRIVDFFIVNSRFGRRICRESRIALQRKTPTRFVRVTNEWVLAQKNLPRSIEKLLSA